MASRTRLLIVIVLALLALAVIAVRAYQLFNREQPEPLPTGMLRIAVDPSNPPFATLQDDQLAGLEIDLGHALADQLDAPAQFVPIGTDGLYDALLAGQVDVIISAIQPEMWRTSDVYYSDPYFDAGLVLVTPAASDLHSMETLSGHALAYEFGGTADQEARRWLRRIPAFETQPYEVPRYALDAVRLGEADAALVDSITARLYLDEHPQWEAEVTAVTHNPYVVAVSYQNAAARAAVDNALEELHASGTIENIVDDWL